MVQQEKKRKIEKGKKEKYPLDERSTWGESGRASRLFVLTMK